MSKQEEIQEVLNNKFGVRNEETDKLLFEHGTFEDLIQYKERVEEGYEFLEGHPVEQEEKAIYEAGLESAFERARVEAGFDKAVEESGELSKDEHDAVIKGFDDSVEKAEEDDLKTEVEANFDNAVAEAEEKEGVGVIPPKKRTIDVTEDELEDFRRYQAAQRPESVDEQRNEHEEHLQAFKEEAAKHGVDVRIKSLKELHGEWVVKGGIEKADENMKTLFKGYLSDDTDIDHFLKEMVNTEMPLASTEKVLPQEYKTSKDKMNSQLNLLMGCYSKAHVKTEKKIVKKTAEDGMAM